MKHSISWTENNFEDASESFRDSIFNPDLSDDESGNNISEIINEDIFNGFLKNIFLKSQRSDDNEIDEKELYFKAGNSNTNSSESTKSKKSKLKKNLFNVSKSSRDELNASLKFISKKRRGRHRLNEPKSEKEEGTFHDKNSCDNILRKVQVRILNYIISYANAILKEFNYEDQFFNLNYAFKNNVNKEFFESLKNSTLSNIVCNDLSKKYKTKDNNNNKKLYEKIKENSLLKKIFDEKFLVLFDWYYKNKKRISLKKYGSKKEIYLPENVETYRDLTYKYSNNEEYLKNINNCICHNYFKNYKFWMIEN